MKVKGGKVGKRKELEEESGKGRKLGEVMRRWKEEKIKEQERGRGNEIKDEEGKIKAERLLLKKSYIPDPLTTTSRVKSICR